MKCTLASNRFPTFTRFVRYHAPYTGSLFLAMAFALVVAVCDLGAIQILADTINTLEIVGETRSMRLYPSGISSARACSLSRGSRCH